MKVKEKILFERSRFSGKQSYSPVISQSGSIAYLCVDGVSESLVYARNKQDKIVIADGTYIISLCFSGGFLFWSQLDGEKWSIRYISESEPLNIKELNGCSGRPAMLSSSEVYDGISLLSWEERQGKKVKVRVAVIKKDGIESSFDITDGSFNGYDPVCTITVDGKAYCAYCAFIKGNYRVMLQAFDFNGELHGQPIAIGSDTGSNLYPSLCSRKAGGVWFSFTCIPHGSYMEPNYVEHPRRLLQLGFFSDRAYVKVGIFDGEKILVTRGGRNEHDCQGYITGGRIPSSSCAAQSRVFEDCTERLHVIFRKYNDFDYSQDMLQEILAEEEGLCYKNLNFAKLADFNYSGIYVSTHMDTYWTKPFMLIPRAFLDQPVSYLYEKDKVTIAFVQDGRSSGWVTYGELFDKTGVIQLGTLVFELPIYDKPCYDLYNYGAKPAFSPSIHEPVCERKPDNGYIYAFGQTHCHSNISVCSRAHDKEPHINYRFMQDVMNCSFGSVTDHEYNMWDLERLYTRKIADYYYFKGDFVALQGYEWTGSTPDCCTHDGGPFGHLNPLSFEENYGLDFYSPCDSNDEGCSPSKLNDVYKGKKIFAIPHHVADAIHPYNWNHFDESFNPVIELFQDFRGSAEKPSAPGVTNFIHSKNPEQWITNRLDSGLKFGFIGGGDHTGLALAGVLTKELTRSSIYEAMKSRRCYASTGANVIAEFTCNAYPMGSVIKVSDASFCIEAFSDEEIMAVNIIKNGVEYKSIECDGKHIKHQWTISKQNDGEYWYCRILLRNGEILWVSPIWLV